MSTKGENTKVEILERAARIARLNGLDGVTIGNLAEDLGMSKSGIHAHFGSKEGLQIEILNYSSEVFVDAVVRPALTYPRGEPRLRHAFTGWLKWGIGHTDEEPFRKLGGCIFVAAAAELDDRPGIVRERLVSIQKEWLESLAQMVRSGQKDGKFLRDVDPEQVSFELHGILLSAHHAVRLFGDNKAVDRAFRAFDRLIADITPSS
jgi:AcrR family transcriptional regulator